MVYQVRVDRFHLEPGQPVSFPGCGRGFFVSYVDDRRSHAYVIPLGSDRVVRLFTITLRPDRGLEDRVLRVAHESPSGMENVVQALKAKEGIHNPWAVAWAMKKKHQNESPGLPKTPTQFPTTAVAGGSEKLLKAAGRDKSKGREEKETSLELRADQRAKS